jgi:hypothetical protein
MSGKIIIRLIAVVVVLSVIFAGCAPEADTAKSGLAPKTDLSLTFSAGDKTMYKVAVKGIKDFKFEQPSLEKLKEEQTGSAIELKFLQEIESVDNNGNAVARITVKGLKYLVKDKSGVVLDYDSESESGKKHYLSKLLGESYKIKLNRDGQVQVVDATSIRRVSVEKIVKNFLSEPRIIRRHEILSLPKSGQSILKQGGSWSRIMASPPGLLSPKNFEKVYTLRDVSKNNIAIVKMEAVPTMEAPEDAPTGDQGMGVFAKMFDSEENFTGQMVLDLNTGKVQKYNEELAASYVAAESPREQVKGKGPDILTMGFTHAVSLEMIE